MQKPDIDLNWLEGKIKDGINAGSVRLPYRVFRVQLKLWEILEDQQKKALIRISKEVAVKLEIVL